VTGQPADAAVLVDSDGDVLRITINRPEKRNALNNAVLSALRQAFEGRRDDERLRLAVVTAAGSKSFAAGGDLREVEKFRSDDDAISFSEKSDAALEAIRRFPLPVIAAINGDALGGGSELAVACDMRIMAAHARIGFIQGKLNISTAWGGGTDLMRLVGHARALSLLARSTLLDGSAALTVGVAEAVAPEGQDFPAFVEDYIAPLRRQTPRVLRAFKAQALAARFGLPDAERRRIERAVFVETWVHDDHWEAADKILAPAK